MPGTVVCAGERKKKQGKALLIYEGPINVVLGQQKLITSAAERLSHCPDEKAYFRIFFPRHINSNNSSFLH